MVENLIEKVKTAAGSIWALWVLGVVSFLESAILPIPVDAFALPVMFANRRRLWQAVVVASLASLAGGCLGYYFGAALADTLGAWIIETYQLQEQFEAFKGEMNERASVVLFIATLSPLPYKLAALASGAIEYSFASFFVISAAGRSLRFFGMAGLIHLMGPKVPEFMERHARAVAAVIIVGTILGFGAVYFI